MRSGNPALSDKAFDSGVVATTAKMTIQGTVNKTFILLFILILGAALVWQNPLAYQMFIWPALIAALVFALLTIFKKEWAPITAPLYALCEGVILGSISAIMEQYYPGIVFQAIALTFGILFALLAVYSSRLIKVTDNFRLGVFAATGGIALYYLVALVLGFFGVSVPLIYDSGPWGILFSLFVVGIASLNLVLDFDFIERAAEKGIPKYMEWYGAFGLMVTLVWLYLEILRLLAKARSR